MIKISNSYFFGIIAEKIAIFFLVIKGYKILKNRYRNYFGEIDIIAKKSKLIIFCEVKARSSKSNLEDILSKKQIVRIKKSAEFFISKNSNFVEYDFRFDLIVISNFSIKHYKNFY